MVDVKVSKRGFIYKEGKKKISDLPRIKDKNDIKITNISQNNINFRTNFIIGEQLKNLVRSQQSKKERFFVKNILDFLDKDANGKILGLYGLRRTGKTVALLQALKHLEDENKKAAYVLMSKNDVFVDLIKDIDQLIQMGFTYIFIDEITYIEGFLQVSNRLSDIYAQMNIHIVVAGADSFILRLAQVDILYDRLKLIHSTYISFKEYFYLFGKGTTLINYIRSGGILSANGFLDNEKAMDYLDTSISTNIINSLRKANNKSFTHLIELDDRGLLRKAIEQAVQSANAQLTLNVITKLFEDHELGSSIQKLADVYNYKDSLNIENITDILRYGLGIVKKDDSEFNEAYIEELKDYLFKIDVLMDYTRYTGKNTIDAFLFTQPGFRYYQTKLLIESLKKDNSFLSLERFYQDLLIQKIIEGVEGDLIEHTVIYSCLKYLQGKNDFIITQYTPAGVGEWDLVIGNSSEMDIYEVKRSNTCNEYQTKWLTDLTMKDIGERFFRRKIRKRIVLYTGNDLIVIRNGEKVEYKNVDKFLKQLPKNIF